MQSRIAIMLAILIFTVSVKDCAVYLSYFANKAYIIKDLCVNRNVDNSTCNGKCHLKKELEESKKQNEKNPNLKTEIKLILFVIALTPAKDLVNENKIRYLIGASTRYAFLFSSMIFHPPKLALL